MMKKTALIFSHTDLDGVGGIIVGRKYAAQRGYKPYYHRCNYSNVNTKILEMLDVYGTDEIGCILISDISVDKSVAEVLDGLQEQGMDILLCDHHDTATWLNEYPWAFVAETDSEGRRRCGTYWLARLLNLYDDMKVFVNLVNAWDCWTWKDTGTIAARNLNALYSTIGAQDFIEYIESIDMSQVTRSSDLFTDWATTVITTFNRIIEKYSYHTNKQLWKGKFLVKNKKGRTLELYGGIAFINHEISFIADYIAAENPELDFLLIYALPRSVSLRTHRTDLAIDLGELAELMTGSGGGHPTAAGATVSFNQFTRMITRTIADWSHGNVSVSELEVADD